jgi:acetylornithine deacetylase/succinyl-diaminopimelate desuccinylase-like protein
MFPGRTSDETQAELAQVIGNPAITIEQRVKDKPIAKVPPLDPAIIGPMTTLSAKFFPGVPVVPTISTGASDGVYTAAVGIPTYGVPGIWSDSKMNNIHGLNEHMEVRSLMDGRDYLYALVKLLSSK